MNENPIMELCVKCNILVLSFFPLFLPSNDSIKDKGGNRLSLSDIVDAVKSRWLMENVSSHFNKLLYSRKRWTCTENTEF